MMIKIGTQVKKDLSVAPFCTYFEVLKYFKLRLAELADGED